VCVVVLVGVLPPLRPKCRITYPVDGICTLRPYTPLRAKLRLRLRLVTSQGSLLVSYNR
jgi:hypothetical protein